jgi:uncharacterized protein (DUF58 family)
MPRPTGRGYALLALAVVTYLCARLVGTWELYLLAFAFLVVVVLCWLTVMVAGRRICVARSLDPDRPVAGDEPEIVTLVKNSSFLPSPHLTLGNQLVGLSAGVLDQEVESLAPRGRRCLRARLGPVNRGVYLLPAAEALAEDPLGLVRSVRRVGEPVAVTVLPRHAFLDSCALEPGVRLRQDWGARRGPFVFGASEFRGVRPHHPGEPLSRIDWKSTAKTGALMLRETEEPADADVTLLLDGTAAEILGEAPYNNFELAVQTAGSVADFVLRAGRGVTLISHERRSRQQRLTSDGAGRRALLQTLAEARPDAPAPFSAALHHLRTGGQHLLRAESVTIISISLDSHLVRTLMEMRQEGARVAFLYVSGPSFTGPAPASASYLLPFLPPRQEIDAAPGGAASPALTSEQRALLLSLSAAGIPCLTLSRGEDLVRHLSAWNPARRGGATVG